MKMVEELCSNVNLVKWKVTLENSFVYIDFKACRNPVASSKAKKAFSSSLYVSGVATTPRRTLPVPTACLHGIIPHIRIGMVAPRRAFVDQ